VNVADLGHGTIRVRNTPVHADLFLVCRRLVDVEGALAALGDSFCEQLAHDLVVHVHVDDLVSLAEERLALGALPESMCEPRRHGVCHLRVSHSSR
jgi:hypothetical protein